MKLSTPLPPDSAAQAPRANAAGDAPRVADLPSATPPPPLILAVNDNPAARAVTLRRLTTAGFAVAEASDGDTALRLTRTLRPALVLLDVVMPGLSGLDVLRLIRSDASLADIPVLLLTAQSSSADDLSHGLDLGADDYIRQPVSAAELTARVRLHLRHKRTETELKASESRLATAQALAHLGSWELDLTTKTGTWSREMCHLLYWDALLPAPNFAGFLERVHPDDRNHLQEALHRIVTATVAFEVEFRTNPSLGSIRYISAMVYAVRDAAGQARRATGTALDITEKKHAAKAITELSQRTAKRERMLSTALASMSDFAQIYDRDGRITFVNEPLLKLWGLTTEEVVGRNFLELGYPRDLAEKLLRQLREVVTTRQRLIDEADYTAPDGKMGRYEYIFSPALDSDGTVAFVVGSTREISERKRAEAALKASEQRYHSLFENMLEGYAYCRTVFDGEHLIDFSYVEVNSAFLRLTGLRDVVGKNVTEVIPGIRDSGRELFETYGRVARTGQPEKLEFYVEALSIWLSLTIYSQEPSHFVAVFDNITARKLAEQALRTSEAELRVLAEAMPQIVWITRADGWNIYFNQRWMDYTGLSLEESHGHGWVKPFHPDDQEKAREAWGRSVSTGETYSLECRLRRADGGYQWWLIRGVPLLDSNGTILKWLGTCTDIDESKRAQMQIAEQAALIHQAREAIVVRDMDDRITFWNKSAERLYGWSADEALGRKLRELLCVTVPAYADAERAVQSGGAWTGEIEHTTKQGSVLVLEDSWTLLRDARGLPRSILTIGSDITDRKKLEQQFLRAQRMESLGTLAGGIAHDLNNLLSPITIGVGLLKALNPTPKSVQVIDNIERSAKRGADLVKQVLSFARGVEGSRVSIQAAHIIKEVESIAWNTFPKNIVVESDVPSTLWTVLADPTQINQVVLNLAVNARDAMPDGGRLEFSAQNVEIDEQYAVMNGELVAGRYVVIQVTDNGHGMPKEIIDRIFEPFFTTKEQGKGTGLGLSTVIGIVRSHGGFVNVYSEVGKGSVFKVYLPAMGEGAREQLVQQGEGSLPRGNGELVLLVDDEKSILSVTKQTLQTFGYRVLTAEDGAQAISQFALHHAEVAAVLTDMMMPVMDGLVLIAAMRRINPQVRVIAASGLNAHGKTTRAMVAGVKHFLAKPYSADALLTILRKVLTEKEPAS